MYRRENHYENIVRPDRRRRYGHEHLNQVAKLKRITVGQSLRPRSFQTEYRPIAQCCVRMITGQQPIVVRTTKSVSEYRRIRGQAVGVKTFRTGHAIQKFIDELNSQIRVKRPYTGIPESSRDAFGNFTIHRKNPLAFSVLEQYFERVNSICVGGGLYITVETESESREEAIALLTGLKVPLHK